MGDEGDIGRDRVRVGGDIRSLDCFTYIFSPVLKYQFTNV